VTELEEIGEGRVADEDGYLVEEPTVLSTGPQISRYLKVEVQNDGSLPDDDGEYPLPQALLGVRGRVAKRRSRRQRRLRNEKTAR
jgi:hypothetical protein